MPGARASEARMRPPGAVPRSAAQPQPRMRPERSRSSQLAPHPPTIYRPEEYRSTLPHTRTRRKGNVSHPLALARGAPGLPGRYALPGTVRSDVRPRRSGSRGLQNESDVLLRRDGCSRSDPAGGDRRGARCAEVGPARGHLLGDRGVPDELCPWVPEHPSGGTPRGTGTHHAPPPPPPRPHASGAPPRRGGELGSAVLCARLRGGEAWRCRGRRARRCRRSQPLR